jgi:hypothetical protein
MIERPSGCPALQLIGTLRRRTTPPLRPASAQAAMRLLCEILEEEGVHRALQADMQFADLALGQGDDADAGKAQPLEQRRDILLIARQPVERLGATTTSNAPSRAAASIA